MKKISTIVLIGTLVANFSGCSIDDLEKIDDEDTTQSESDYIDNQTSTIADINKDTLSLVKISDTSFEVVWNKKSLGTSSVSYNFSDFEEGKNSYKFWTRNDKSLDKLICRSLTPDTGGYRFRCEVESTGNTFDNNFMPNLTYQVGLSNDNNELSQDGVVATLENNMVGYYYSLTIDNY